MIIRACTRRVSAPACYLGRPAALCLAAGIRAVHAYEQLGGWRRMVSLRVPARRNALGGPVPAQPSQA
jgi:hypothetical protein